MNEDTIHIRLMRPDDLDALVRIDEKILEAPRREYYAMKFEMAFESRDYIPTSLVAETTGGTVVGFVMGQLYIGEYGISQYGASLDTIGVDPEYRHKGIGEKLIEEFIDHLKHLGVKKLYTMVGSDDVALMRFFTSNRFSPSKTISLERNL